MDSLPINILDIAVGAVLIVSAFFAFARGLAHELFAVAGWIGAILATIYGFPYAKPYARQIIAMPLAADLAAGVVIFILTLIVLSVFTRMISKRVQDSALNAVDRSLGFLFGLARGAVLICLAYIGYEILLPKAEHPVWMTSARSLPLIQSGSRMLVAMLPETAAKMGVGKGSPEPAPGKEKTDIEKSLKGMLTPTPKRENQTPPKEGYGDKERQDMQRLIDSTQQDKPPR